MPLFEFSCRKCGHVFEELMSASELDKGGLKCPACNSKRVERALSAFATGNSSEGSGGFSPSGGCGSGGFT
jgi:putative FmdB family regulatory protein